MYGKHFPLPLSHVVWCVCNGYKTLSVPAYGKRHNATQEQIGIGSSNLVDG